MYLMILQIDRGILFYSERKREPQTVTPISGPWWGLMMSKWYLDTSIYSGCTPNYPLYYGETFMYLLLYKHNDILDQYYITTGLSL